jgi:YidC/Oxa1 family membrane protein insertase
MIAGIFEVTAKPLEWFYELTHNYILAISLIALVVMLITAPLVLKSTKGMLEMQKLQPEMRRLQQLHRGDRQKLNEEMMKLYQEHKVNPLNSCFPLLLQFPVFIVMWRILHGLTAGGPNGSGFAPKYISKSSALYKSLLGKHEMLQWGLDLSKRPSEVIADSFGKGMIYALLVVALGILYFAQQRMIAARAMAAPTMSATQQKIMQYLPVVFAVFLVFYLTGLVIYYMAQAIFRIGLQAYITRTFYRGDHSLGRQAQAAGEKARELHKAGKEAGGAGGGGGMFAQARRDAQAQRESRCKPKDGVAATPGNNVSKRVTPPKNKPTPAGRARPAPTGRAGRPGSQRPQPRKK